MVRTIGTPMLVFAFALATLATVIPPFVAGGGLRHPQVCRTEDRSTPIWLRLLNVRAMVDPLNWLPRVQAHAV